MQCEGAAPRWMQHPKQYGTHFAVDARVGGLSASVLLRIFDQGLAVDGRPGSMGKGLRLATPTPGTPAATAPATTPARRSA